MKLMNNPFKDDEWMRNMEFALVRAFLLFEIAQKLITLMIAQVYDALHKIGWV
ncbi:MAG: hypothetical protein WAQ99_12080 [Pyrinomonadaceae bacterium]